MSDQLSLVMLTTITPDPENRGGPSGLPWEILEELTRDGWQVHTQLVPLAAGRVQRRLMQLAVQLTSIQVERTDADAYIVYPSYLGRQVPPELRSRTLVLGPDATSMLYARCARIESGWRRWRSLCLSQWFKFHEMWLIRNLAGMLVVGRNDARWLRHFAGPALREHVHYVPHPVLHTVTKSICGEGTRAKPRLVFSGDLSRKYIGDFFDTFDHAAVAAALSSTDCEIIVIGKGNRHVYDLIAKHLPARYEAWVDNYATFCDPLRDVHAIPLMAGAGTKNRTLTALAMNVIIVSTPIGIENIDIRVLHASNVHRFRSGAEFPSALAAALLDLQARRFAGTPPSPPPIGRITNAFRAATRSVMRIAAAVSFSSQTHT